MEANSATTFFVWDTADGKVAVEPTQPSVDVHAWPLQTLRASGPHSIRPPASPMTTDEFASWRDALKQSGIQVEIRFKSCSER